MKLKYEAAGSTDIGLKRDHNEDSILVQESLGLFAVADGMGGHAAGEVASGTAVDTLEKFVTKGLKDPDLTWPFGFQKNLDWQGNLLYTGINLANRQLTVLAEKDQALGGMGTTIVAILVTDEKAYLSHVGDSRIYRFRDGRLEGLTQDHSWVNEQVQKNMLSEKEARTHRWRNVITRALGDRKEIAIDMDVLDPVPGELYLLCSDGLTTMIEDDQIAQCLAECNGDLASSCHRLVKLANEAGGLDNISVVLVRVTSASSS